MGAFPSVPRQRPSRDDSSTQGHVEKPFQRPTLACQTFAAYPGDLLCAHPRELHRVRRIVCLRRWRSRELGHLIPGLTYCGASQSKKKHLARGAFLSLINKCLSLLMLHLSALKPNCHDSMQIASKPRCGLDFRFGLVFFD